MALPARNVAASAAERIALNDMSWSSLLIA
jgi:hypothetical protein